MKIFLVVEDWGFYTNLVDTYISADELNSGCHSVVHFAETTIEKAKEKLNELVKFDEDDWEVEAEKTTYRNMDQIIEGYLVLGSFYYIQEVELDGD